MLVIAFFLASVLLFLGAFLYLDREKHRVYYYEVSLDGHDIGTVKVDKFDTEDRLIYKSVSVMPFNKIFTSSKQRIDFDKKYNLESYSRNRFGNGTEESAYLENRGGLISFISKFNSEFIYATNIAIRRYTLVFEEDSPVTYLPLVENYDFKKGRSQGSGALSSFSADLPPMKRYITLTSIKDEYIKIGKRNIKAENLILKIRNYPQGSIWVAKSDKSILKIEIPRKSLKITRVFSPRELTALKYALSDDSYTSKEVSFKNKNIQLSGTLTVPNKPGAHPAVLLISGPAPQNRQAQGLFTNISDYLSKNGFLVLRYDNRGVGSSGGDSASSADSDQVDDAAVALDFLASQKEANPEKIFVIGHSQGAYYAARLASNKNFLKGAVLMAPALYEWPWRMQDGALLSRMATKNRWNDDYLKLVDKSIRETIDKVKGSNRNWAYILGKRCFLKNIREKTENDPLEAVSRISIPVLILQGREDDDFVMEYAADIDKALERGGNSDHALIYYSYLGHLFGTLINDGMHRMYYDTDSKVMKDMLAWLNRAEAGPDTQP